MSSNIQVQRICQFCNNQFTAKTTVTKFCSKKCSRAASKDKERQKKILKSDIETLKIIQKPLEDIKNKEFLTVQEVATLLNCSKRTAYYYIENGNIPAVNLGQRMTRVKRSEIDKLFSGISTPTKTEEVQYSIAECYTITEIEKKYGISNKALYEIIKRESIPKIKEGRYSYVPKTLIDKLFQ